MSPSLYSQREPLGLLGALNPASEMSVVTHESVSESILSSTLRSYRANLSAFSSNFAFRDPSEASDSELDARPDLTDVEQDDT